MTPLPAVTPLPAGPGLELGNSVRGELARSGGSPLPSALSAISGPWSEPAIRGARVFTDVAAHATARRFEARALTYGQNIFLGEGESAADLGLMAHEMSHVAQQAGRTGEPVVQLDAVQPDNDTRVRAIAESIFFYGTQRNLDEVAAWLERAEAEKIPPARLRAVFFQLHQRPLSAFIAEHSADDDGLLRRYSDLIVGEVVDTREPIPGERESSEAVLARIKAVHGIQVVTPDRAQQEAVLRQRHSDAVARVDAFNLGALRPAPLYSEEARASLESLPRRPIPEVLLLIERAIVALRARFGGARLPGVKTISLIHAALAVDESRVVTTTDLNGKSVSQVVPQIVVSDDGLAATYRGEQTIEFADNSPQEVVLTFDHGRATGLRQETGAEAIVHTTLHELTHATLQQQLDHQGQPVKDQFGDPRAAEFQDLWRSRTGWVAGTSPGQWSLQVKSKDGTVTLTPANWASVPARDKPVSAYGAASPNEDMAEAFAFYVLNPQQVAYYSPIRAELCAQIFARIRGRERPRSAG